MTPASIRVMARLLHGRDRLNALINDGSGVPAVVGRVGDDDFDLRSSDLPDGIFKKQLIAMRDVLEDLLREMGVEL